MKCLYLTWKHSQAEILLLVHYAQTFEFTQILSSLFAMRLLCSIYISFLCSLVFEKDPHLQVKYSCTLGVQQLLHKSAGKYVNSEDPNLFLTKAFLIKEQIYFEIVSIAPSKTSFS